MSTFSLPKFHLCVFPEEGYNFILKKKVQKFTQFLCLHLKTLSSTSAPQSFISIILLFSSLIEIDVTSVTEPYVYFFLSHASTYYFALSNKKDKGHV